MFKRFLLLVVAFCSLGTVAFGAPLKVWPALLPENDSNLGRHPVSLHFNQPVVGLGEDTAFSSDKCPFTITPAIEGTCRYSGTQTLVFEPKENWPAATRYTITLPAGFTSETTKQKLAKAYSVSFNTATPQVRQVLPYNNEHWVNLTPVLYVSFSMPVKADAKYVQLWTVGQRKNVPVAVREVSEEEFKQNFNYGDYKNALAIVPMEELKKGVQYTLTLKKGFPPAVGTQGLAQAHHTRFYTYPSLSVLGTEDENCLPSVPKIKFTTPVRLREVMRAVSVIPEKAKVALSEEMLDSVGNETVDPKTGAAYFSLPLSFLDIKPAEEIQITLNGNVQDIYGNTLGKDYSFVVSAKNYCPSMNFSSGFGVLESYFKPLLPVELMNIASLSVQAARFNKDNFIPFDQQETRYCGQKSIPSATFAGNYDFKAVQNKGLNTFLDLRRFGVNAKDSIVFTQVNDITRHYEKECWTNATNNVTDVGVTFKTSPSATLVWATSLKEGLPMTDLPVELRDAKNNVLWKGKTAPDGLAIAPGWKDLKVAVPNAWSRPEMYAFVTSAGGTAVVSSNWNDGLEPWRFNLNYSYAPDQELIRGYLFTERGIYRPGEKVYIKGVIREQNQDAWAIPQPKSGKLVITDARGKEVLSKEVTLSDNGTFGLTYDTPKNAPTGTWYASFKLQKDGKEVRESDADVSFQVQAAKQADFGITFVANGSDYMSGEEAVFNVAANYQFGAPLSGAKAKWSFRKEYAYFEPSGFQDYTFNPYFLREDTYAHNGELLDSATGNLDDKGAITLTEKLPSVTYPTNVYGEVSVISPANQELFNRTSVLVHPGDIYIGAKTAQNNGLYAGKPVTIDLVAVTPEGERAAAIATAKIYKYNWYSVRKSGLSGRLEWVSEKQKVELPSQSVAILPEGSQLTFTPKEGGFYYVELTASDLSGRKVKGGTDVYVYGQNGASWQKNDDDLLVLKQDKNEYKVGQKARVTLESPYPDALALVSVERGGILDAWIVDVGEGSSFIEVPIKENYLPNAYVSVVLVRGRSSDPDQSRALDLGKPQVKVGYVNLNVIPDRKQIVTTIKSNAQKFRPGEKVTLKVNTKVKGKAVPAEVAVMVVDEGILALTNYKTPDLFHYFYGAKPLSVSTMDNRAYVVGQRSFGEKGENRGGGGAASAKLGGVDLRTNFSFVPFYQGAVQTDKKGNATVTFTLPDNLTKFRVMAVAMTDDEFGAGETSFKVSKPLMVTPHLPRFLRKGDEFTCGAIVYNFEDKSGGLVVEAEATGMLSLQTPAEQGIYVPLGESRHVSWKCKADDFGEAAFSVAVTGKKESDGFQVPLEVMNVEKAQTLSAYQRLDGSETSMLLKEPSNVLDKADNYASVTMASTALLNLKSAMQYLLTYSYDCLEQRMSKILPVIMGEKLVKDFNLGDVSEYKQRAQEVLNEIPLYQTPSGGFAYWKNSAYPDVYVTAYALETALEAEKAGYKVPQKELQEALKWLETAFNKDVKQAYDYSVAETNVARAYVTYVLALYGKNVDSTFNNMYTSLESLNPTAIAYLLKTAYLTGRERSVQLALIRQLGHHVVFTSESVYVEEPLLPWVHADGVSATAVALDALLFEQNGFDYAFQMASWLLKQMDAKGHWSDTHTNALVVKTLDHYYREAESREPDFEAFITQGYKELLLHRFKGRSLDNTKVIFPFKQIYAQSQQAKLTFIKHGPGTLYYTLAQTYVPKMFNTPVDSGFSITRELTTLDGQPVKDLQAGDRYKVKLKVKTTAARHFVVLEDFIAAGLEIANTSLATESQEQAADLNASNAGNGFFRAERYDDRLAVFADYLPAGEYEYTYIVSAVAQGKYGYPAAWVSQMYEPSVFGRTNSTKLVIK